MSEEGEVGKARKRKWVIKHKKAFIHHFYNFHIFIAKKITTSCS